MNKHNVIAFSLWGNNPKYTDGVVENLKLSSKIYPDWKVILYVNNTVSIDFLKKIHKNYEIDIRCVQDNRGPLYGAYWRFLVNDDPNIDKYLIRDLDSRINWREQAAVNEWLSTDNKYHIMRDHPHHRFEIQAGMWGGTANLFKMSSLMNQWNDYSSYCCDQYFLRQLVYPLIKNNCSVHDPFIENKPFPKHLPFEDGGTHVGQVYINNIPQIA